MNKSPEIVVSRFMPALLRIVFGCASAALAALLVVELLPGLWPISILTPFFGVIVGGGLAVLGLLFLAAVAGPGEVWRIRRGAVEIEQRVLLARHVFVLAPEPADCRILRQELADSEPSWHILIDRAPPPLAHRGGWLQQTSERLLSVLRARRPPGLRSPGFTSELSAQAALAVMTAGAASIVD